MQHRVDYFILFFLVAILLTIFVVQLIILVIKNSQHKIKKKELETKKLQETITEIYNQKLQITKEIYYEKLRSEKQLQEMQQTVDNVLKEKELTEQLLKTINSKKDKLLLISTLKSAKLTTEHDWLVFQEVFTIIYPDFIKRIKSKNEKITPAEIKILVLAKLNISYASQAIKLGVSVQAIQKVWYRFKKKNNLSAYKTLQEYANSI